MTSPKVRILLVTSLLANLFLAGVVGGGLVMISHQGGLHPRTAGLPIRSAGDGLPQPDRAHFRQAMLRALRTNIDLLRIGHQTRRDAADLFVMPQFDEAAIGAALARSRDADIELRARLETAALDFAASLPQDERIILAAGLERGGPLRHPKPKTKQADPIKR